MKKALKICLALGLFTIAVMHDVHSQKGMVDLHIRREKNLIMGRLVDISVFVNETLIGTISNGEEKLFRFKATKTGISYIRFESPDIVKVITDVLGTASEIPDSTLINMYKKEFEVRVKKGTRLDFFCTFNQRGLYVRRVEK